VEHRQAEGITVTSLHDPLVGQRLLVFFSYVRKDAAAVRTVVDGLEALHHTVWIDKKLSGGQDWWDQILARIRECDVMVVAVSLALLESEAAAREREYARQLGKPLLPVLIEPVLTDLLPWDIAPLQIIDYTATGPMTGVQLAAALVALPRAPDLPAPLPTPPARPQAPLAELARRLSAQHLPLEDQLALVAALRVALGQTREQAAATELLQTLQRRPDLYHATWQELQELSRQKRADQQPNGLSADPAQPRQQPESTTPPGWYPDPSSRHQLRWFDGDWTPYASDHGTVIEDPDF
jgi:hypothetical protein